jgi:hypothetical protein
VNLWPINASSDAAKLLPGDEARRIQVNIAKLAVGAVLPFFLFF